MKVFVTGGTGFVGREVLWRLHEAGHNARLLVRPPLSDRTRQLAYRHGAELVMGTLEDGEALVGGMTGCDAVIHLVGIIHELGDSTFARVHVGGTEAILAAADQAGVRRLVHMSALGTRVDARARYHQTKWQAEERVRAGNLDWTILRPSVIYGREDGFVNLLARVCKFSPVIPLFGGGRNRLQPIAVESVATAFVRVLNRPDTTGRTLDLCGGEVFTLRELYNVILRVTSRWRPQLPVPMAVARAQATLMEILFGLIGRASPLTRDQLLMLEEDNCGDPAPATQLLGLQHEPFAEGIARYLT